MGRCGTFIVFTEGGGRRTYQSIHPELHRVVIDFKSWKTVSHKTMNSRDAPIYIRHPTLFNFHRGPK